MEKVIHTTKTRKLIGPVHTIESEFAVFESLDEHAIETKQERVEFERYDRQGRLVEEISGYRMQIDGVYRDVYIYDPVHGELLEHQEYNEAGNLTGKEIFEPGPNLGRIAKSYYFGWDNELILSSILVFDAGWNLIEVSHFDANGDLRPKSTTSPSTTIVTRQLDEFTTEEQRFAPDGSLGLKVVNAYDSNGNKTEFSCIDPDGTLGIKEVYEYEFDAFSNWTSNKTYRWVTGWGACHLYPHTITRRKIAYYPE